MIRYDERLDRARDDFGRFVSKERAVHSSIYREELHTYIHKEELRRKRISRSLKKFWKEKKEKEEEKEEEITSGEDFAEELEEEVHGTYEKKQEV